MIVITIFVHPSFGVELGLPRILIQKSRKIVDKREPYIDISAHGVIQIEEGNGHMARHDEHGGDEW